MASSEVEGDSIDDDSEKLGIDHEAVDEAIPDSSGATEQLDEPVKRKGLRRPRIPVSGRVAAGLAALVAVGGLAVAGEKVVSSLGSDGPSFTDRWKQGEVDIPFRRFKLPHGEGKWQARAGHIDGIPQGIPRTGELHWYDPRGVLGDQKAQPKMNETPSAVSSEDLPWHRSPHGKTCVESRRLGWIRGEEGNIFGGIPDNATALDFASTLRPGDLKITVTRQRDYFERIGTNVSEICTPRDPSDIDRPAKDFFLVTRFERPTNAAK